MKQQRNKPGKFADALVQDMRSRSPQILKDATQFILDEAKQLANETDHSLEDLRKLGYPYAARDPHPPHEGNIVHRQGGELFNALEIFPMVASGDRFKRAVGIDLDKCPHALYVVFGTEKMVGRDFLRQAVENRQDDIQNAIKRGMKRRHV